MNIEVRPYFVKGERYPALIGVRAKGDEYETAYVSKSELADALAENAKLRELARDYHMFEHGDCHSCRYHDDCRKDDSCRCIAPVRLADRMRELGVDVDDSV